MRHLLILFACLLLLPLSLFAQKKKKASRKGNTEEGMIYKLEGCLAAKDAYCYMDLFPDLDTLTKLAMKYSDSNSRDFRDAYALQESPAKMMRADSFMRASLKATFDSVIRAGEIIDISWENIIPVRYELAKARQTRAELYEKLAPYRFNGYIFFMDRISRRTYGMQVGNIMQIAGEWYGGYLTKPYEAATIDEYQDARALARKEKKPAKDTLKTPTDEQDENSAQKTIVERKFYSGMFDKEIPVQLYVRGLKGGCPQGVCYWEGIYKFGDNDGFIRLLITRTEDGKWQMAEDPAGGTMDLTLSDKKYTGGWSTADGQTGYDVELTEIPATEKKIIRLDAIFDELKNPKKEE